MPAAVAPSVRSTVGNTPSRAPRKPQTSLPAAPPREKQGQGDTDFRDSSALCPQQKRQKGQKTHSCRAVDDADRQQKRKAIMQQAGAVAHFPRLVLISRYTRTFRRAGSQQQQDGGRSHETDHANDRRSRMPRHHRDQASGERRQSHLSQIAGKVVGAKRPTRARPFVSCGDEAGGNRVLGARADAAQNKRYREHGDARARAEEEIGRCCRSGAGRKNSDAANPLRRPGDRNLQPRHHAGIKCAQKADRGVAQRELSLPQRQKHIERIGKAVMQRVGAAGHPKYARSVSSRLGCRRERSDRHNSMPSPRRARSRQTPIWQYDGLMTNDLF